MSIVGGFDVHRRQITFDYVDTDTGRLQRGRIAPACRAVLRRWLAERFVGRSDVEFAVEACTGWRFVVEELERAGIEVSLAETADTAAARGRKRRAKTDPADAAHLRELLAGGRLPTSWIPPEQVREMRAILELYKDLRDEHTAWVQRIQLGVQRVEDPQRHHGRLVPGRRQTFPSLQSGPPRRRGDTPGAQLRHPVVEQGRVDALHPGGVLIPQILVQLQNRAHLPYLFGWDPRGG